MKWTVSNQRLPDTKGFYYCEDSVGQKTMVHFYDNHWHSLTGHPVAKWLDESPSSEVKEQQGVERTETRLALVTVIRILQRRVNIKAAEFSDNELKLFDGAKNILSKYQQPSDILR